MVRLTRSLPGRQCQYRSTETCKGSGQIFLTSETIRGASKTNRPLICWIQSWSAASQLGTALDALTRTRMGYPNKIRRRLSSLSLLMYPVALSPTVFWTIAAQNTRQSSWGDEFVARKRGGLDGDTGDFEPSRSRIRASGGARLDGFRVRLTTVAAHEISAAAIDRP